MSVSPIKSPRKRGLNEIDTNTGQFGTSTAKRPRLISPLLYTSEQINRTRVPPLSPTKRKTNTDRVPSVMQSQLTEMHKEIKKNTQTIEDQFVQIVKLKDALRAEQQKSKIMQQNPKQEQIINDLRQDIEAKEVYINELHVEMEHALNLLKEKEVEVEDLNMKFKSCEDEIQKSKNIIQDLHAKIDKLNTDCNNLETELERGKQGLEGKTQLELEYTKIKKELNDSLLSNAELNQRMQDLIGQYERMLDEVVDQGKVHLKQVEQEHSEKFAKQRNEYDAALSQLKSSLANENNAINNEVLKLQHELSISNKTISDLQLKLDSQTADGEQLIALRLDNEKLRSMLTTTEIEHGKTQQMLLEAQKNHNELRKLLVSAEGDVTKVQKELENRIAEIRKEVIRDHEAHILEQKLYASEMSAEVNKCVVELDDRQREITSLKSINASLEMQLMAFKSARPQFDTNVTSSNEVQFLREEVERERAEVRKLQNAVQNLKGSIRLIARVRPTLNGCEDGDLKLTMNSVRVDMESPCVFNNNVKKYTFLEAQFDRVFGPDSSNADVAEECDYLIQSAIDGQVVSVLAYGQTGSGKSFTMNEEDGITPHALQTITKEAARLGNKCEVYVEAVEIYNEQLKDLLSDGSNPQQQQQQQQQPMYNTTTNLRTTTNFRTTTNLRTTSSFSTKLSIKKDERGIYALSGATPKTIHVEKDAFEALKTATKARTTSSTACNERSSRSHLVFSVHIKKFGEQRECLSHGILHLVDLAGSERITNSKVSGVHAQEATSINQSLSTLKRVFASLMSTSEGTQSLYPPFRDSKLTLMLMASFSSNAKTMMLIALSPELASKDETKQTLRFAIDASNVVLKKRR